MKERQGSGTQRTYEKTFVSTRRQFGSQLRYLTIARNNRSKWVAERRDGHTENQTHNYNCEGMWKTRIQTIDRQQPDILLWLAGDFIQTKKVSLRFPRRGQLRSARNKGRGGHLSSLRSRSRVSSVPGWWAVPLPRLAGEVNRGWCAPCHTWTWVRAAADGGQGRSGPWSWGGTRWEQAAENEWAISRLRPSSTTPV